LNLQPESTPADPRLFAKRLRGLTPAAARMSKGGLQNCLSYLDAALSLYDTRYRRRRSLRALAPHRAAFLRLIPDRWRRQRLWRFMHFLDENNIAPEAVDDETFDAFRASLAHSMIEDIRTRDRETRKIWNALVADNPECGCRQVTVPNHTDHFVLPEAAFPAPLWTEVEPTLPPGRRRLAPNSTTS